jgi:hypothetical protein
MFLKCNWRFKDGKEHRYWSIVESRRCAGGQVVQRPVLYLGEINDSQRESWCRTIAAFDPQRDRTLPLALFPADVVDGNGHVNNVVYIQWMQDAAIPSSSNRLFSSVIGSGHNVGGANPPTSNIQQPTSNE